MKDIQAFIRARLVEERIEIERDELGECTSYRRDSNTAFQGIVDMIDFTYDDDGFPVLLGGCGEALWDVYVLMAAIWATHPGYDETWVPEEEFGRFR